MFFFYLFLQIFIKKMANINSEDVGNRNKNEIFNGIKVIYINKRYTSASSIESGKNIFNNI